MGKTRERIAAAAVMGALVAMLGCSDSSGPDGGTLAATDADDVAVTEADELEHSLAALLPEGAVTGTVELGAPVPILEVIPTGAGCAEVSSELDTDGDGAPDEATFVFALPACHFSGFRGGRLDITGTIVLSDPTPGAADFAWRADLDDFQWAFDGPEAGRSYTATRNGSRVLAGNADALSLTNTVTVVRTFPVREPSTVAHNLLLTFTADTPGSLVIGEPLPDARLTHSGTFTWSRNGKSRTFTVTTVAPLIWEASCGTAIKVISGETRATLADGSYVRTVWTGCGVAPERTFVPLSP